MVKFSVVVFVYKRYVYLGEAVRSVALQTRLPDGVLVFTDNREAVKGVLSRHGVSADVFYEPGLPKPAVYALVGRCRPPIMCFLCMTYSRGIMEVLGKVLERTRWPLVKHAVDYRSRLKAGGNSPPSLLC